MSMTEEEYYQEISALSADEAWQICQREGVEVEDPTLDNMQHALLRHFVGAGQAQPEPMLEHPVDQPPQALDPAHEAELWRVLHGEFERIDLDRVGTIDRYDFYHLAELMGHGLNDAEVDDAITQLDVGAGRVNFDGFFVWFLARIRQQHERHDHQHHGAVPIPANATGAAVLPPMSCPPQLHELEGLMAQLSSPSAVIEELDLSFQSLGEPQLGVLGSGLGAARQLKRLDVRNNGFGNDGARALAGAIPGSSIVELDLRFNGIGVDGTLAIARALIDDPDGALQLLDMRGNRCAVDGCEGMAEAVRFNRSLAHLDLGVNALGNEGAWELADALDSNNSLEFLGLSGNDIDGAGLEFFITALRKNSRLRTLGLSMNKLGDDGARAIATLITVAGGAQPGHDCMLHTLELDSNSITDEGADALGRAMSENVELKCLNLRSNYITKEKVEWLLQEGEGTVSGVSRVEAELQKPLASKSRPVGAPSLSLQGRARRKY
jgi:hypothetical protein